MSNRFPIESQYQRKACVDIEERCPECGGGLDTGWECNDCGFDAQWIAYPQEQRDAEAAAAFARLNGRAT